MATINGLTEDFESGTNGADVTTSNSIFDSFTGGGTVKFTNDALYGSLAMVATTVSSTALARADTTARSLIWVSFYFKYTSLPGSNTGIAVWYGGTDKIGDLRLMTNGGINIRDMNTNAWTSTPLAANVWHRIAYKAQPGSSTGHRVRIYSGADLDTMNATQDSGDQTATNTVATSIDNVRFGIISADTVSFTFDRLRGDDASEPVPPATSVTATVAWLTA